MPVFVGRRIQRGRGIGSIFAGLAKNFLFPLAKSVGTSLLKKGIQKTTGAIDDIAQGKTVKQAFKDRFVGQHTPSTFVATGAKRAVHLMNDIANPTKRRRTSTKRKTRRHKRRQRDIFD